VHSTDVKNSGYIMDQYVIESLAIVSSMYFSFGMEVRPSVWTVLQGIARHGTWTDHSAQLKQLKSEMKWT
jgi:hypothetical protein